MDQTFRCCQNKNLEKQTNFDILRTVIPKRIEHTRQTNPCFSSTPRALSDCNIYFCLWNRSNFTCMGSPCALLQNPLWSVKYRSKCSKGYKNCKIFVQNMLVNLYLHILKILQLKLIIRMNLSCTMNGFGVKGSSGGNSK